MIIRNKYQCITKKRKVLMFILWFLFSHGKVINNFETFRVNDENGNYGYKGAGRIEVNIIHNCGHKIILGKQSDNFVWKHF